MSNAHIIDAPSTNNTSPSIIPSVNQSTPQQITIPSTEETQNIIPTFTKKILSDVYLTVDSLNAELKHFGFAYFPQDDIFYSIMNGWQRECGYCELYDEASVPLYMIIDCEPIYFNYNGKKWLIEFWKGQYGMTTGCEIGIYSTAGANFDIPGVFNGTFFYSATDDEMLHLRFSLFKNNEIIVKREALHWWLTAFRLGEFSHPSQLSMEIEITFKDKEMCHCFLDGMKKNGYTKNEIQIIDNTITFLFDKPHYTQPIARNSLIEEMIQIYNRRNCEAYQSATKNYNNTLDKLNYVKREAPKLYHKILNVGNTTELFKSYQLIHKFMQVNHPKDWQ